MATIMVVDDVPENVRLVRKIFAPQGFDVLGSRSGEDALELLTRGLPDLMIVDLRLGPGAMTGYDLAARVRGLPGGESVPLVALTAALDDEEKTRAAGFDEFIAKPCSPAELSSRVKGCLERRQKAAAPGAAG